jgi:hypothetical protein
MTKRATCTQAQVRRIIKAAEKEGLCVTGIKPDGTIIVCKQDYYDQQKAASLESESEVVL